jgi:LmbE family N-acetylglucosaminyl deacetylase
LAERSLLALYAHPDDEAICGGTLAIHAAEGARVTLVCATRGEEGEISDPALATPETLPRVRENELRCAASTLGIEPPRFLDFRDSGMNGTAANRRADAFMNAGAAEVVARLVGIIREVRPQVVITFDPTGMYGHPDHIAISRHTSAAVDAAASDRFRDAGEPWQVARVAYGVFPRSFFAGLRDRLLERGEDADEIDELFERGIGVPDAQVDLVVDVSSFIDRKFAAIQCHRTQFGGDHLFSRVGEDELRRMMGRECFAFARPPARSIEPATSLFP